MRMLMWILLGIFGIIGETAEAASLSSLGAQTCLQEKDKQEHSRQILAVMTALPSPAIVPVMQGGQNLFVPTSTLFAEILGLPAHIPILNDTEELRFISYTLAKTPLLLLVKSSGVWDEDKARKVLQVAKMQGIAIFLIWIGDSQPPSSLEHLVSESGGRLWDRPQLTQAVLNYVCP